MDFSETIEAWYHGRCSQATEYMKLYEYRRSRSFIDLDPNLSDSGFLNFFSSITTGPVEAKFHVEPLQMGEESIFKMVQITWPRLPQCPYMVKTFKNVLLWNLNLGDLKLSMHHQVLEYYQICWNDAPPVDLTNFMARSNLVPYAFVWEKN